MRTVASIVGVVAIGTCALCGCSFNIGTNGSPTVSKVALQDDIADRLTKAGEQPTSVTCKEDLVGEVGKQARCEVVMNPTNSFEPIVTVTGVDGTMVNYEMAPALSKEQVERAVSNLVKGTAGVSVDAVSCEAGLKGEVGATVHCDVDAGGVELRRTVEVSAVDGLMMHVDVVPILTRAEVEDSLLEHLRLQLDVPPDSADCTGNLEGKPGNSVDCTVVAGPDTLAFTVTVTAVSDGKIGYNYEPKA